MTSTKNIYENRHSCNSKKVVDSLDGKALAYFNLVVKIDKVADP